MDAAIDLNNETLAGSAEVNDEGATHELSPNFHTAQLPVPQYIPQHRLRRSRNRPKFPRPRDQISFHKYSLCPSPSLYKIIFCDLRAMERGPGVRTVYNPIVTALTSMNSSMPMLPFSRPRPLSL
jgi:hypothetical protein